MSDDRRDFDSAPASDTPRSSSDHSEDAPEGSDSPSGLAEDISEVYRRVRDEGSIRDIYDKNPYAVLASAAGVGYLLGGGLFTPFTKRIGRIGMKALVVPLALSKVEELTQAATRPKLEDTDEEAPDLDFGPET